MRQKNKYHSAIIFIVFLLIFLIPVAIMFRNHIKNINDFSAKDPTNDEKKIIVIKEGMNANKIGELLESTGIIKNSQAFVNYVKKNNLTNSLQSGSYELSEDMDIADISNKLANGLVYEKKEVYVKVVIPEGYEIEQIIKRLVELDLVKEDEFRELIDTCDVSKYHFLDGVKSEDKEELEEIRKENPLVSSQKSIGNRLEGFLFPATYEFKKGESQINILHAMLDAFNNHFKKEYYKRAEELGMSVEQIITLASVIEREGADTNEFKTISGVFYNRLKTGMKLQSCATVQYIIGERKPRLSGKEIAIKSPYNTYLYAGLPRGPIASPGILAIEAALYPEDTPYFYFVADTKNKGKHIFSKTLKEHEIATKKSLGSN